MCRWSKSIKQAIIKIKSEGNIEMACYAYKTVSKWWCLCKKGSEAMPCLKGKVETWTMMLAIILWQLIKTGIADFFRAAYTCLRAGPLGTSVLLAGVHMGHAIFWLRCLTKAVVIGSWRALKCTPAKRMAAPRGCTWKRVLPPVCLIAKHQTWVIVK